MLAVRLPDDIENRLAHLASETGCSKSFYVRQAVEKFSEEVEYREYRNQKVFEKFENMSSAEKKKILLEFEKHIEKTVYSEIYAREELDNILVRDNFSKFFCSQRTELLPTVLNFKEYVESR